MSQNIPYRFHVSKGIGYIKNALDIFNTVFPRKYKICQQNKKCSNFYLFPHNYVVPQVYWTSKYILWHVIIIHQLLTSYWNTN